MPGVKSIEIAQRHDAATQMARQGGAPGDQLHGQAA
jgi:hypothetical protein